MSEYLTDEERIRVQSTAFLGYVMYRENCSKEHALGLIARACKEMQKAMHLGHKRGPRPDVKELKVQ